MLSDKILRLQLSASLKAWVLRVLRSSFGRRQIERVASGNQMSMRNVSQGNLRRIVLPLPPDAERRRLAAELQIQATLIGHSGKTLDAARLRIERLRQSILKWAFEGKLVDQDPDDEPAAALLDRIKAEREASAASTKTQKRGRRKARSA